MGFIRSTLGYLSGASLLKKQASYIKGDFASVTAEIKAIGAKVMSKEKKENGVDEWNTVVINYGINTAMMMGQYRKRRIISGILLCTFFISIYFVVVDSRFFVGFPAVFVSFIFYMSNALRLFQIRQRELCKWKKYLSAIKISFKELLPLALPDNWQLMQSTQKSDVANNTNKKNEENKVNKKNKINMENAL